MKGEIAYLGKLIFGEALSRTHLIVPWQLSEPVDNIPLFRMSRLGSGFMKPSLFGSLASHIVKLR